MIKFMALVAAIAWAPLAFISLFTGFPVPQGKLMDFFPWVLTALLFSPSLGGLLSHLTAPRGSMVLGGLSVFLRWKIPIHYYLIPLVGIPGTAAVVLGFLSLGNGAFTPGIYQSPDVLGVLAGALALGFFGAVLEELGWTLWASRQKRFQEKPRVMAWGLGFFWGLWHIPITLWASGGPSGALDWNLVWPPVAFYLLVLPVFRSLMTWCFLKTESFPLAVVLHGLLIATTIVVFKPRAEGLDLVGYYSLLALILFTLQEILWRRFPVKRSPGSQSYSTPRG